MYLIWVILHKDFAWHFGEEGRRRDWDLKKALGKAQAGIVTSALVIISELSELLQNMITLLCVSLWETEKFVFSKFLHLLRKMFWCYIIAIVLLHVFHSILLGSWEGSTVPAPLFSWMTAQSVNQTSSIPSNGGFNNFVYFLTWNYIMYYICVHIWTITKQSSQGA